MTFPINMESQKNHVPNHQAVYVKLIMWENSMPQVTQRNDALGPMLPGPSRTHLMALTAAGEAPTWYRGDVFEKLARSWYVSLSAYYNTLHNHYIISTGLFEIFTLFSFPKWRALYLTCFLGRLQMQKHAETTSAWAWLKYIGFMD